MPQADLPSNLVSFPLSPRFRWQQLVAKCPAFQAIADHLPETPDRPHFERVLASVFRHMLHPLSLTYDDAVVILRNSGSPLDLAERELARLSAEPAFEDLHMLWSPLYEDEVDEELRGWAMYCVAAMARLYRLERPTLASRLSGERPPRAVSAD